MSIYTEEVATKKSSHMESLLLTLQQNIDRAEGLTDRIGISMRRLNLVPVPDVTSGNKTERPVPQSMLQSMGLELERFDCILERLQGIVNNAEETIG